MPQDPSLFIGSSSEGLNVAEEIRKNLERTKQVTVTVWNSGVFTLGDIVPDKLRQTAAKYDFAVIVFSPDDIVISRGTKETAPRDNVVFELGLFAGTLGRERTFAVVHEGDEPKLPSDFKGVTYATYSMVKDERDRDIPSVRAACDQIMAAVDVLGRLRHPKLERALYSIVRNHRDAFKVEHPLFQDYLERWCATEKTESSVWGQGLLRISLDYHQFLSDVFRAAEKSIFSTSGVTSKQMWNNDAGKSLLRVQSGNTTAHSTRVFIYKSDQVITAEDVAVMKLHKEAGVEVRVYRNLIVPGFGYDPDNIENEWDMIDEGRAIGITKSVEPNKREAYWYFEDAEKAREYVKVKRDLLTFSKPLEEWLLQHPQAA